MRLLLILLFGCLGTLIVGQQKPADLEQPPRFGAGVYDYYGYIAWDDVDTVPRESRTALALMRSGDYAKASTAFRNVLKRSPAEPTALQGLIECMRKLRKLESLYNEFGIKLNTSRIKRQKPDDTVVLCYQYVLALISHEIDYGDNALRKINYADNSNAGGLAYGSYSHAPVNYKSLARPFWIMYLTSLSTRHLRLEARETAREMLRLKPGFYQIRLLYSLELRGGVYKRLAKDNKTWIDPPVEVRENPEEALRQAKRVIEDAPNWQVGIYSTAGAAYSLDKPLSRKLFRRFLDKADPRSDWAIRARYWLAKLG